MTKWKQVPLSQTQSYLGPVQNWFNLMDVQIYIILGSGAWR